MKRIVNKLISLNKTISTMESCTGGLLSSEITNIEGSSQVLKFSAVTYSNEYKLKMGVSKDIIDNYSVYSMETSIEMAHIISKYTSSSYGVGITGKLNRIDENNDIGKNNEVFINVYDSINNIDYPLIIIVPNMNRKEQKEFIIKKTEILLKKMLNISENDI